MLLSPDQRFTCAQCGRCCRRATVPVTLGEAEAYRNAGVERWFSEPGDPFAPIPEHPSLLQIRKRPDGACGFLSETGLCRIHEELGFDRKPIACRVFPLRFHPVQDDLIVTASFACPTIVGNEGTLLSAQARDISTLWLTWKEAQPESEAEVEFVSGRRMPPAMLPKLRSVLTRILDTPAPDGSFDLAVSLRRIAAFIDDLSRRQVLVLSAEDFAQYFDVMSRHALSHERVPPARRPSRLTRLLFRGFLLASASVQLHLDPALRDRTGAIRLALVRVALHLHGLRPAASGFDLNCARSVAFDPADDDIRETATHYLRSTFSTIGTGRRPIVDELCIAVAHLNAAIVLARMRTRLAPDLPASAKATAGLAKAPERSHASKGGKVGPATATAEDFRQGLMESADLMQADAGGIFSRLLTALSGGIDAFYLFPVSTI